MEFVDIGANLTHESFRHDRDQVLERARTHGVSQIVVIGASEAGARDARELAALHPGFLYATAGVHPHHASDYTSETEATLRALLADPLVRAAGETGLDYNRNYSPRAAQLFAFERQLELGYEAKLPLFLHQRDAHGDFMALLKPVRDRYPRAVVHCFTGTREELYDYLDLDLHIGITGWICDERRGTHLRELAREIPAHRLMIETDAPYLMPRTLKPHPPHRRNEPMFLPHIAAELARNRGEDLAMTAANANATARAFFNLPAPAPPL